MIARLGFASAAALAALSLAAVSHAEDLRLAYGDLDLSQPAQAKVLDQRIARAAQNWCAGNVPTGSLLQSGGCVGVVRQQLVASLPAPARAAYLASQASLRSASTAAPTTGS